MSFGVDFAARILRPIDQLIADHVQAAASGAPATEADYRTLVGVIRGLRLARAEIVAPFGPREQADLPRGT